MVTIRKMTAPEAREFRWGAVPKEDIVGPYREALKTFRSGDMGFIEFDDGVSEGAAKVRASKRSRNEI